MENRINVAELLRNCPKGMELDCTIYEDVVFHDIVDRHYPIRVRRKQGGLINLNAYGCMDDKIDSKCVIFPKGKTTWEGFQRPFEDGDIIVSTFGGIHIMQNSTTSYCQFDRFGLLDNARTTCVRVERLATEEEKQKLFQAIKDNGYKWNAETKTLEKLIEPKFNVGNKIKHKTHISHGNVVTEIKDTYYILDDKSALSFTFQDEYELVPDKFDINTLVPFESKVLVRNDEHQYWIPAFWGFKGENGYTTTFGWCKYCIPFEGNEHLFKTKNDCDEFFKTWK